MIEIHESCRPYNMWWTNLELELARRGEIVNIMDQATFNDLDLCEAFIAKCHNVSPNEPVLVYVSDVDSLDPLDTSLYYLVENGEEAKKFYSRNEPELFDVWIRPMQNKSGDVQKKINRVITVTDIERDGKTFKDSVWAYFNVEQKLLDTPIFDEISYEVYSPTQGDFKPFNTLHFNGFSPIRIVDLAVSRSKLFVYTMNVTSTPWRAIEAIGRGTPFLVPRNAFTQDMPESIQYSSMDELECKIEQILSMDETGGEYLDLVMDCQDVADWFMLNDSVGQLLRIRDSVKERGK